MANAIVNDTKTEIVLTCAKEKLQTAARNNQKKNSIILFPFPSRSKSKLVNIDFKWWPQTPVARFAT